jgi:hypothetical protein
MVAQCEGYRGVVMHLELWLWKFTDASRDVLASVTGTTDIETINSQPHKGEMIGQLVARDY